MKAVCKGITALDLLITLTIVTVLLSAGVPAFRSYGANQRMKAAVTALQSDLQHARGEAIALAAHTVVCPGAPPGDCRDELDWDQGWMAFVDLNGDRQRQPDEPLLRAAPPLEAVAATSPDSRKRLRFFPNGSAPGSNTSILFCDHRGGAYARQIRISNSGRIRRTNDPSNC